MVYAFINTKPATKLAFPAQFFFSLRADIWQSSEDKQNETQNN
jgi:hypothetical protein